MISCWNLMTTTSFESRVGAGTHIHCAPITILCQKKYVSTWRMRNTECQKDQNALLNPITFCSVWASIFFWLIWPTTLCAGDDNGYIRHNINKGKKHKQPTAHWQLTPYLTEQYTRQWRMTAGSSAKCYICFANHVYNYYCISGAKQISQCKCKQTNKQLCILHVSEQLKSMWFGKQSDLYHFLILACIRPLLPYF